MLKFSDVIVMTNRDCKKRWGDVFPTQVCAHKYVNKVSVCEVRIVCFVWKYVVAVVCLIFFYTDLKFVSHRGYTTRFLKPRWRFIHTNMRRWNVHRLIIRIKHIYMKNTSIRDIIYGCAIERLDYPENSPQKKTSMVCFQYWRVPCPLAVSVRFLSLRLFNIIAVNGRRCTEVLNNAKVNVVTGISQ